MLLRKGCTWAALARASLAIVLSISGAHARDFTQSMMPTVPLPVDGSGAVCVPSSSATEWNNAQTLVVEACVNAAIAGCSADSADALLSAVLPQMQVVAGVLARLRVLVVETCVNPGDNVACVAVSNYADATTSLAVNVMTSATATAMNSCSACGPDAASATASIFSNLIVELNERVSAVVTGQICLAPNQATPITIYAECTAQIHAHAFATAMAQAMIAGDCTNLQASATVSVDNLVSIDATCKCGGFEWACPSSAQSRTGKGCRVKKRKGAKADDDAALAKYKKHPATYAVLTAQCSATSAAV